MVSLESFTDIGICFSRDNYNKTHIFCLENDGLNFCCRKAADTDLVQESSLRVCCTYEQYSDQMWTILATVQALSSLLTVLFILLLIVMVWFFFNIYTYDEIDVGELKERRAVKELLKSQILKKSSQKSDNFSIIGHIKKLSKSLSSSLRKRHKEHDKRLKEARKSPTVIRSPRNLGKSIKSPSSYSNIVTVRSPHEANKSPISPPFPTFKRTKVPQSHLKGLKSVKSPDLRLSSSIVNKKSPASNYAKSPPAKMSPSISSPSGVITKSPIQSDKLVKSPTVKSSTTKSPIINLKIIQLDRNKKKSPVASQIKQPKD